MYRAVLDACVLVPSLQRDFLLQLASEEAFAPLWSSGILAELDYTLAGFHARKGIDDSERRRSRLLSEMNRAFPGAEVDAPRQREYDYGLKDSNDGHVAHAAITGKADVIVTDDRRAGFETASLLSEASVEIVFAKGFASNTVAAHPQAALRALVAMSDRRRNPPRTPEQILDLLVARYGMDEVAETLRPLLANL